MLRWTAVALLTFVCIANPAASHAGSIKIAGENDTTPIHGTVTYLDSSSNLVVVTTDFFGGEIRSYDAALPFPNWVPYIADYCLNALTPIDGGPNSDSISSLGVVNGLSVQHANEIAWLVMHVGVGLHGGDLEAQAGLQAAIWNLAGLNAPNGGLGTFDLDTITPGANTPGVIQAYIDDLALAALPAAHNADVSSVLWISIPSGDPDFPFQAQVAANPVPEPSSMCLAGFGLLGLIGYQRSRSRKSVV